jgi:phage terminase large subunit GpA-like protein
LWWPEEASSQDIEAQAALMCPSCGSLISDSQKTALNAKGVYIAPGQSVTLDGNITGVADTAHSKTASFWVSGLCSFSSKKTFGFLASKYVAAQKSGEPERLQGVMNTDFGELFKVGGDAPLWTMVAERQQTYRQGEVPDEVAILTAGVDVQKNRLVYVIRGWGPQYESWLIEHGELWGETDQPAVWHALSRLTTATWHGKPLSKMAVDSGYQTQAVYNFCRLHPAIALPTKGHDHLDKPFKRVALDVMASGKTAQRSLGLWHFNSDHMKSWVHSRIARPVDQPGGWWLPEDISEDYCKQMVAEQRSVNANGKVTWITVKRDNHYLDAEALAYLVIRMLTASREERLQCAPPQKRFVGVSHHGFCLDGGEVRAIDPRHDQDRMLTHRGLGWFNGEIKPYKEPQFGVLKKELMR